MNLTDFFFETFDFKELFLVSILSNFDCSCKLIHLLTNNKILDISKLKTFAQELKFVCGSLQNIEGKEENACYQHFLLVPAFFLPV